MQPILVIAEDHPDILAKLVDKFEELGWSVRAVNSGDEAYNILISERVDLILSDIRMPNGTGIELLRRVRRLRLSGSNPPPVIIMTGMLGSGESYLRALGASDVIEKPFALQKVIDSVYKCTGREIPHAC